LKASEPKRILIVKLSAIGDVVHTLPFLEALRAAFPGARIDWLVEEEGGEIVRDHPALDRLIVSHRKTWQRQARDIRRAGEVVRRVSAFVRDLRSTEYDLVIDLQGLFKSALLTGLARGKRKVGPAGGREGSRAVLTEPAVPVDANEHAVDRYLRVARALGCNVKGWTGRISVGREETRFVDALVSDLGLKGRRLVAVNPMARWPTKLWDPSAFAALVDRVAEEFQTVVVLTGGKADRPVLETIRRSAVSRPHNLSGRTSLKQLAALYHRCDLLVSTDTGPMHVAAAVGCPVVALFGPTAPWRTGPYGKGHRVVRVPMTCSPCFRKTCDHMRCMQAITPDLVLSAVRDVLSGRSGDRAESLVTAGAAK